MRYNSLSLITILFLSLIASSSFAQKEKKVHQFQVERIIELPAEQIWAIVGEDYGSVAYSHPKIISSEYINGSLKAEEGAERVCNFNEKGSKYLKEKMVNYNPSKMTFINKVYQAGKFPVNPDYTKAIYKVESLGENKCKVSFDMTYRTTPAFMGGMAKGQFKNLIRDYFISVEHHAKTGVKVTKNNFKTIKKQYQ